MEDGEGKLALRRRGKSHEGQGLVITPPSHSLLEYVPRAKLHSGVQPPPASAGSLPAVVVAGRASSAPVRRRGNTSQPPPTLTVLLAAPPRTNNGTIQSESASSCSAYSPRPEVGYCRIHFGEGTPVTNWERGWASRRRRGANGRRQRMTLRTCCYRRTGRRRVWLLGNLGRCSGNEAAASLVFVPRGDAAGPRKERASGPWLITRAT